MIDDRQRATFARLADALIPGDGDQPTASAADAHGRWLDRALATRPDLAPELAAILDEADDGETDDTLARLRSHDLPRYELLLFIATASYLMSPRTRRRIGYPGQRAEPVLVDEAEYYLDDGDLLEPVRARGPRYVPTPPEPA